MFWDFVRIFVTRKSAFLVNYVFVNAELRGKTRWQYIFFLKVCLWLDS